MKNILEELYYGNLDPQARSLGKDPALVRMAERISQGEQYFSSTLSGADKAKFLEYADAWGHFDGESCLDSFLVGFRLGARFCWDTFVSRDAPFDPLEES